MDGKHIYPAIQYGNVRRTPHPATRTLSVNGNRIYFLCKTYLERAHGGTRVRSIYAAAFNGDRAIPDWVAYRLDPGRIRAYENSHSLRLRRSGSQFYMDQTLKEMGVPQAIPACFYKVVHDANTGESWAYLMANTGDTRGKTYKRFIITVADLRKRMRKAHRDKTQAQKYYPRFSKLPRAGKLPRRYGTMPNAIWYRGGIKRKQKPKLERYPMFRSSNFPGC